MNVLYIQLSIQWSIINQNIVRLLVNEIRGAKINPPLKIRVCKIRVGANYASKYGISGIQSKKIGLMGHAERMGEKLNVYGFMVGNLKETDLLRT